MVQDIRLDHMSMLVYNTLTTLVLFDTLDKERFEIGTEESISDEEDSNVEAENILNAGPSVVIKVFSYLIDLKGQVQGRKNNSEGRHRWSKD